MYAFGLYVIPIERDTLGGRFLLFSFSARVLCETSVTHSFIFISFAETQGIKVMGEVRRFVVHSPLGSGSMVRRIFRDYIFSFVDYEFRVDLFVMLILILILFFDWIG